MVRSRKELAVFLSRLQTFKKPQTTLEQYSTESDIAAQILWQASLDGNIEEKTIIDLGCGTGILGIGALLLGAKHIIFVDIDASVKQSLDENLAYLDEQYEFPGTYEFVNKGVKAFQQSQTTDPRSHNHDFVVVMNPPFGTKIKHADRDFLACAHACAHNIYSMHKTSTKVFLEAFSKDNNLHLAWQQEVLFPLKNTMKQHQKTVEKIEVLLIHLEKN